MTEITKLPGSIERFVLHWGDMGAYWGVNRSVAQIHALLMTADAPMTAEDIANALEMARSNVSNSLKELQNWNLIRRVPIKGDRRDHFEAETDVWEVASRIAAGRKAKEIDPAVETLRACVAEAETDPKVSPVALKRLKDMLEFTETIDRWYGQITTVARPKLMALLKLGARIAALIPGGK
ncbi:GbsR/MarR family transcriptional regulator [Brevundimonas sp. Root1279]|uniref:GbsR/MarR family transcriptional regulator n=1 Tax=Brevundimonas sp. Root1279 TaxID=1736443 RepID=UPI0006FC7FF4|nr:MarR family transcriptional regulator [Brevundimonas sp. Root1279]KQW78891.1 ArsR family transcriptional regulator [Brevundimonas sp. Root1279]